MFNDSDHQTKSSLTIEQLHAVIDEIKSSLDEAEACALTSKDGSIPWYALEQLHRIAKVADEALKGIPFTHQY